MNTLTGNILDIETNGALSLVKVDVGAVVLTSIVIDTPDTLSYLKRGNKVKMYFKETEVILAKDSDLRLSLQNRIPCHIEAVVKGNLLSEITLRCGSQRLKSIITTNAAQQLDLQLNDRVVALVKTNEISLAADD